MWMLTFILVLVVLLVLFPSVPEPLKMIIGIIVGLVVIVWLLGMLGYGEGILTT